MTITSIIVIEDSPKHQSDATRVLTEQFGERPMIMSDLDRFMSMSTRFEKILKSRKEAGAGEIGVLTDLYFPACDNHGELAPLGIVVMMKCRELGIPCVIVTSGHHHGLKYHQATSALRLLGMGNDTLVDHNPQGSPDEEADTKDWARGLKNLLALAPNGAG